MTDGTGLQLIQPITQSSGVDSAVQGLCAFLLGICYEFNRDPGPITRCVSFRLPSYRLLRSSSTARRCTRSSKAALDPTSS